MTRVIAPDEWFRGERCALRLVTLADCTPRYVAWLNDVDVTRHLETRWSVQDEPTIRSFVAEMVDSASSYLFAIVENATAAHIGNIKIGPIDRRHRHADVSYFIGERTLWGRGFARDAIGVAVKIAFERLDLHRVQAGLYETNVASGRALEKVGFTLEGRLRKHVRGADGWEDVILYGLVRDGDSG